MWPKSLLFLSLLSSQSHLPPNFCFPHTLAPRFHTFGLFIVSLPTNRNGTADQSRCLLARWPRSTSLLGSERRPFIPWNRLVETVTHESVKAELRSCFPESPQFLLDNYTATICAKSSKEHSDLLPERCSEPFVRIFSILEFVGKPETSTIPSFHCKTSGPP